MPHVIALEAPASPSFYRLPPRQSFVLLAASAVYDGTALNADYVPSLEVLAPNAWQMFEFGQDLLITQHGVTFVTFAPNVSATQGKIPATTAYAQTGMPALEYGPGYTLSFGGRDPTNAGTDPSVVVSSVTLYVESTSGDLDSGKFTLINPVLVHKA